MKKSLLALAVLGAYAGVASAQSSVTLFGTVDMAGSYVKNDTTGGADGNRWSLATNGINSSQLGFRGIEDLGGGLKAGFYLLADLANVDTGGAQNGPTGTSQKFFGRRSTVSLYSNFGELRLGRDYTPTFWNLTIFDAFGTNGVGSSLNPRQLYEGTRSDNSIGYFLPSNLGGFYGQIMGAAPEGGTTLDRAGRYLGGRIGFAAGPFDVAGAYGEVDDVAAFTAGTTGTGPVIGLPGRPKLKAWNIGGSWDFGIAKLMGYYDRTDVSSAKEDFYSISAVIPFGQSEVHVGYDHSKLDYRPLVCVLPPVVGATCGQTDSSIDQWKATYQYNLSKRTAMYGTVSWLDNKDASARTVLGGSSSTAVAPGGKSTGYQIGVRHFF